VNREANKDGTAIQRIQHASLPLKSSCKAIDVVECPRVEIGGVPDRGVGPQVCTAIDESCNRASTESEESEEKKEGHFCVREAVRGRKNVHDRS